MSRWQARFVASLGFVLTLATTTAGPATAEPVGAAAPPGIRPASGGLDSAFLLDGRITLAKADAAVPMSTQTFRTYAFETQTTVDGAQVAHSPAWVVTRPGAAPTYGRFAPVTVTGRSGATPVSVTLRQTQVVDPASRTFTPLDIVTTTRSGATTNRVTGLTDLVVVRATVGPRTVAPGTCRTVTPVQVQLRGDADFDTLAGGLLRGTFDLPAFAGCGDADLDAALTAALSGPGNRVVLARGAATPWSTTAGGRCARCTPPPPLG